MAYFWDSECTGGYGTDRFVSTAVKDMECAICLCVLYNPMGCHNKHFFCKFCITRHLETFKNKFCPLCLCKLTTDELEEPPAEFIQSFSELLIRCEYYYRGCIVIVQLGDLRFHVNKCGFTPVACGNGCGCVISRHALVRHETELCERRAAKCHSCRGLEKEIQGVKRRVFCYMEEMEERITRKFGEIEKNRNEMRQEKKDVKESLGVAAEVENAPPDG